MLKPLSLSGSLGISPLLLRIERTTRSTIHDGLPRDQRVEVDQRVAMTHTRLSQCANDLAVKISDSNDSPGFRTEGGIVINRIWPMHPGMQSVNTAWPNIKGLAENQEFALVPVVPVSLQREHIISR